MIFFDVKEILNQKLVERVDNLIIKNPDSQKYLLIKKILLNEKCFFEMDCDTAISLLIDLEYTEKEAIELYKNFIDSTNF